MARRQINLGLPTTQIGFLSQQAADAMRTQAPQPKPRTASEQGNYAEALAAALSQQREPINANGELLHQLIQGGARAYGVANDVRAGRESLDREQSRYADALEQQGIETKNDAEDRDLRRQALQGQIEERNRPETNYDGATGNFYQLDPQSGAPRVTGRMPGWRAPASQSGGASQPPSGYRFTQDGNLEAIPGGPADIRANAVGQARADQLDASARSLNQAIGALDRAIPLVAWDSTGVVGQGLRETGGTRAFNLNQALEPVRAILSFETLAEMRRNSATGGALGSIAVRELELLGNIYVSLNTAQSTEEFERALTDLKAQLVVARDAVVAARGEVGQDQPTPSGANNRDRGSGIARWGRGPDGRPVRIQ